MRSASAQTRTCQECGIQSQYIDLPICENCGADMIDHDELLMDDVTTTILAFAVLVIVILALHWFFPIYDYLP